MVRKYFGELFESTLRILTENDPLGLISSGAPTDEYEPEVETILLRLHEADSQSALCGIVYEEFVRWFDPEIAGHESEYGKIASEIWAVARRIS